MKLTIWIPNYNWWKLLLDTIESCDKLWLTKIDYEILILDNCSTDNSYNLVHEIYWKNSKIKWIDNQKNFWRIWNRNRVLEESKWDKLLFLMVWDELESIPEFALDKTINTCYIYPFLNWLNNQINYHQTSELNTLIDRKKVIRWFVSTIWHEFWLAPLQSYFFDTSILKSNNIRFNEELEYITDVVFILEYISKFQNIYFSDKVNIKWWASKSKFTYQKQLLLFSETLNEYPNLYENYLHKEIKLYQLKIFLFFQSSFIYFNNKRLNIKWYSFKELIYFIKNKLGSYLYLIFFPFLPIYILYLYINIKTNFKYFLKF